VDVRFATQAIASTAETSSPTIRHFSTHRVGAMAESCMGERDLAALMAAKGIRRLYTHRAAAAEAVHTGKNVVIVTPTASGKTLCYNLPVLNANAREFRYARAIPFPNKKPLRKTSSLNFMTSISVGKPLRRFYLRWRHACRCAAIHS